jgi:hypothetical protein
VHAMDDRRRPWVISAIRWSDGFNDSYRGWFPSELLVAGDKFRQLLFRRVRRLVRCNLVSLVDEVFRAKCMVAFVRQNLSLARTGGAIERIDSFVSAAVGLIDRVADRVLKCHGGSVRMDRRGRGLSWSIGEDYFGDRHVGSILTEAAHHDDIPAHFGKRIVGLQSANVWHRLSLRFDKWSTVQPVRGFVFHRTSWMITDLVEATAHSSRNRGNPTSRRPLK